MSVRNTILVLMKRHELHQFTLTELKEHCKNIVNSKSPTHFNSLIYKTLWIMEKKGLVVSAQNQNDKNKNYSLTEHGLKLLEEINVEEALPKEQPKLKNHFDHLARLISDYSVALAEASAEAQEYQELSLQLPDYEELLQAKFIEAKSRAAKFKGRLAAVENLLRERYETSSMAS